MSDSLHDLLRRGFRYAVSLCGDAAQAEDLLQDAWISVDRAKGPTNRAYLFRAIKSRWIDGLRRPNLVLVTDEVDPIPVPPTGQRRVEDRSELAPILEVLRPDEREVLYLCVVEGYSASEAGELLGKPRNTVLSLLHRGRQRVREALGEREAL